MECDLKNEFLKKINDLIIELNDFKIDEKISIINDIKVLLHENSPFKNEPVDCVLWIKSDLVKSNNYNPNKVANPELKLLEHSILQDGYTQPIVGFYENNSYEVVDGFHRNKIGKECKEVKERIYSYLPLVNINDKRSGRTDRIAATIRHNKARGKHQIEAMSDIVLELNRRSWSDKEISKELGMDMDEVLRLKQISGLADLFKDDEFSKAWEI